MTTTAACPSSFSFEFDCPKTFYLLDANHKRSEELQCELDAWFSIPHESASKPFQEDLLAAYEQRHHQSNNNATEHKENHHNQNHSTSSMMTKRKRPLESSNISNNNATTSSSSMQTGSARLRVVRPATSTVASSSSKLSARTTTNTSSTTSSVVSTASSAATGLLSPSGKIRSKTPQRITTSHSVVDVKRSTSAGRVMMNPSSTLKRTTSTSSTSSTTSKAKMTLSSATSSSSTAHTHPTTNKDPNHNSKTAVVNNEKSLELLLKQHNARFAPVPAYEPPRYSVRDVRKWEKLTNKVWSDLKPEEREKANEEIGKLKATNSI